MKKFAQHIKSYSFLIVLAIMLIVTIGLAVSIINLTNKGMFFIPDNDPNYCYDILDVKKGEDISKYKNVTKIAEYVSTEPITKLDIAYSRIRLDESETLIVKDGRNDRAFAIDWRNTAKAHKVEFYMSASFDGHNADKFRKEAVKINFAFESGALVINLSDIESAHMFTFGSDEWKQYSKQDSNVYRNIINEKLKIQFYTIITD